MSSAAHAPLVGGLAILLLATPGGAQGPSYGCPLSAPALTAEPSLLGGGGWVSGGGVDDRRAVGIDAWRNRVVVAHAALDLQARRGTPVLAIREGRVVGAGRLPHLGVTILVEHRDETLAVYALLGSAVVTTGATLRRGVVIGTAGFSGDGAAFARRPEVLPRVHIALVALRRATSPAELWTALGATPDAWVAALDALATPLDPRTCIPASCFAR